MSEPGNMTINVKDILPSFDVYSIVRAILILIINLLDTK